MDKITEAYEQQKPPLNHKRALKLSFIFSFVLLFFMSFVLVFDQTFTVNRLTIGDFVTQYIVNFFALYLLYEFCFWVFLKEWKFTKKYLYGLFGTFILSIILSLIFSKIVLQVFEIIAHNIDRQFIFVGLIKDMMAALIVFLSTLSISVLFENQEIKIENQELRIENVRNRYEALKNKLRPHFLFNALNTLGGLIKSNNDKAGCYLQNLSATFRYTIQNEVVIALKEELDFVKSYTYLMQIRYGGNLSIQYAVDEKYNYHYVMPISLQLLVENAIKHNVINDKYPLTIYIETTENATIKIYNAIQRPMNAGAGKGTGLVNLIERYRLMLGADVIITKNDIFTVEIPLINEAVMRKNKHKFLEE